MGNNQSHSNSGDNSETKEHKANIDEKKDTWACQQCTFVNHSSLRQCEICGDKRVSETKENKSNIDEKKEHKSDQNYADSDSDDNHEVLVHDCDLRKEIHELGNKSFQNCSFIKCIGQIETEYVYPKQNYKATAKGTGTVIKTKTSNGDSSAATAFVLSAAHVVRHTVWHCCDTYFEKTKICQVVMSHKTITQRKPVKTCPQCKKTLNKKEDSLTLKATSIEFKRRVTAIKGFGDFEESYECKVEFLDEWNYSAFPYPKSGFDWVLLSFVDEDDYYWKHCKNIELERVNTSAEPKHRQFVIIGYPGEKVKEMWGYKMKQNAVTLQYKTSQKTQNSYLFHKEIDASKGQSGAAIATQIKEKTVIWGIHVGGNAKGKNNKYNIGTLLDANIIGHIQCIINGTQKWANNKYESGGSYVGFVRNGKAYGYGKVVYWNGDYYEGSYQNGNRHGYGKFVGNSGLIMEENWRDDALNGYAKVIYASGNVYEGNYENYKLNGYGKATYNDGSAYFGNWKDHKKHGKGKELDKNGNILYEGQYENDAKCN